MSEWHNVVLTEDTSIREAMRLIDASGLRIALVWDASRKLKGIITDGDIRRGLLSDKNMEDRCISILQRDPLVCHPEDTRASRKAKMQSAGVLALPIVDSEFRVVGLETIETVNQPEPKENVVFVMAGGFGTRLRPLTENCPKPMLPLDGKPILERILDNCVSQGFRRFVFATHYLPEQIRNHFEDGKSWNVEIDYLHESEPLGTAGALNLLPGRFLDQSVVLLNGDILSSVNLSELLRVHSANGNEATICVTEKNYQIPYGVIEGRGSELLSIKEKPNLNFRINTGIYALGPDFVRSVPENVEIDIPSLIQRRLKAQKKVGFYVSHDYWLDIGTMSDYRKAQQDIVWLDASAATKGSF